MYLIDFICRLVDNLTMFEMKLNKTLKAIFYEKIIYVFYVDCLYIFVRSKIIYCEIR